MKHLLCEVPENFEKVCAYFENDESKIYANLIIHDDSKTKPTEQECINGLAQLQSDYNTAKANAETKKASGKQKLLDLGLTEEEVKALIGI